ncbi:unnamed protein product [Rotaria sp. Silwood1]|nr:unnamed protein product [Rotaria sp. Silwood1]CAF3384602.1 unnamed protein product [Rotaria sp. Silwood1]
MNEMSYEYYQVVFSQLGVSLHDIDIATTATTNDILKLVRGDSNIKLIYICAKHFGTLTLVDTIARACEITY